jgi:eukaryotic-like serine/threonine-protein kinase
VTDAARPTEATRSTIGWKRIDAIFSALLDLPPAGRDAALVEQCAGDEALAAAVRRLLDAERRSADAFDAAAASVAQLVARAAAAEARIVEEPIDQIGPWRIVERLGAGGMSVVWRGERNDGHFAQTVAIKLLRRWIENDETVQRFHAERRILAGLEHPNLARLLDGGVIGAGWPYFVMEYVDGVPITDYCDRHRLDVDARLELFGQVLTVVQYAHGRLVVHRDLKPSNILVTADGRVKLLDFGIAKVLDSDALAAAESELTERGGRPMTPAYASPEQVSGEASTTASDVYALGVLLYLLLTGRSPYQAAQNQPVRLREAVLTEIPANPSARVLEAVDGIDPLELARLRDSSPMRLARRLRGDLDIICQVALRKEPDLRYATVEQLAADLYRHRRRLPVTARAGNRRYLAARFVRRNAWAVAAGVLIPLTVFAGLGLHVERLSAERDRAETAARQAEGEASKARQVTDYLVRLFRTADPAQSAGQVVTATELVERGVADVETLSSDPGLQAEMFLVLGQVNQALGQYPSAAELQLRALAALDAAPQPATLERADVLAALGFTHFQMGRLDEAERFNREALDALAAGDALRRAPVLTNLGIVHLLTSRYDQATVLLEDALAAHAAGAPGSAEHATTLNALGTLLSRQGRHAEAIAMLESAVAMRRELFGDLHPATSVALGNLATALVDAGDPGGAEAYVLQALAIDEQVLGDAHPSIAVLLNQLAGVRRALGDAQGSILHLERALAILRESEDQDGASPAFAYVFSGLGNGQLQLGLFEDAAANLEKAIAIWEQALGAESRELAVDLALLGVVRLGQSRLAEAQDLLDHSLAIYGRLLDDDHPLIGNALRYLAEVHRRHARIDEALAAGRRSLDILSASAGPTAPPVLELTRWVAALETGAEPPALTIGAL